MNFQAKLNRAAALVLLRLRGLAWAFQGLLQNEKTVPYSSIFSISNAFSFPQDFSASDYPGLLFCHILNDAHSRKLVAYWNEQAFFGAYSDSFKQALSLTSLDTAGPAVQIRQRKRGFWERYSIGKWILSAAALFGALSAFNDYFAGLFAAPDVSIAYSQSGRLDIVEGMPVDVPVRVFNQVRFTSAQVTFDGPTLRSRLNGRVQTLSADPSSIPSLGSGQSQEIRIYGDAPRLSAGQGIPEIYDLAITANAKAGMTRRRRNLSVGNRQVRIWPALLRKPTVTAVRAVANSCQVDSTLYVAKSYPQGLFAEMVFVSPRGEVSDLSVGAATATDVTFLHAEDKATTTRKIEFRTVALDKFQEFRYTVYVQSPSPVAQQACAEWSKKIEADFRERE